ncbi:hypothetical protein NMG90_24615 [Bacillus mycoides]|uniref:hypothetical protein n=1 Tax=Bacillus mycoides TaxID=1405 RepID=UPI00099327C2|nr:hypothetical protein [Bacillus mycoides]MCP9228510.1 hypothetical protein [Bacillus mycoides]OOR66391.1 hypothetical protein BLW98_22535 [Bacillus mycoides]
MDWLDKAASNAKIRYENEKKTEEKIRKLKEAYPDYLKQLWLEFEDVFREVEARFGAELTNIKVEGNFLTIKVADITIEAISEQHDLLDGYFAAVYVTHKVPGISGGPELPYRKVYFTYDSKWVYVDDSLKKSVNKQFGKEQIAEIFKVALWKYLI